VLEDILTKQFQRKGDAVVAENVGAAKAGYEYAAANFKALPVTLPAPTKAWPFSPATTRSPWAAWRQGSNFTAPIP